MYGLVMSLPCIPLSPMRAALVHSCDIACINVHKRPIQATPLSTSTRRGLCAALPLSGTAHHITSYAPDLARMADNALACKARALLAAAVARRYALAASPYLAAQVA